MGQYYKSNWIRSITTTVTRAVGPTTITNARGTLPVLNPNNTNSCFVAPNGSDANPGTLALPKLTIAAAIATLGGAKTNVQVVRNTFVGELLFTSAALITLPAGCSMQTASKEYAVIARSTAGNIAAIGAGSQVNSIWFDSVGTGAVTLAAAAILANCMVTANLRGALGFISTTDVSASVVFSAFGNIFSTASTGTRTITLTNNIMYFTNLASSNPTAPIEAHVFAGNTVVFNATRCYIRCASTTSVNTYICYTDNQTTGTTATFQMNFAGCTLASGKGFAISDSSAGTPATVTLTNTLSYTKNAAGIVVDEVIAATVTNSSFAITNALSLAKPPLYRNESGFLGATTWSPTVLEYLRLQISGVRPDVTAASGPPWGISSPLKAAYLTPNPDEDAAPWNETQSLPAQSFQDEIQFDFFPMGGEVDAIAQNLRLFTDINGNPHQVFDAQRRRWQYTAFSIGPMSQSNDIRRLVWLQSDTGPAARMYALGNPTDPDYPPGGHLAPIAVMGALVSFNLEITPVFITTSPGTDAMINANWRGYWLEVDPGLGTTYHYYITSNSSSRFFIEDRLGAGFPPDGTYDIAINYILVTIDRSQPIKFMQDQEMDARYGRRWAEFKDSYLSNAGLEHLWQGAAFALDETDSPNVSG